MTRSALLLVAASMLCPAVAHSSSAQMNVGQPAPAWRQTASVGPTVFLPDVGEGNFGGPGAIVRAGVRFPLIDVTVGTEYWPHTMNFRILSTQIEGAFYLSRAPATPLLLMSFGHTWSRYMGPGIGRGPNGAAAAIGLGMHIPLSELYALRTEALLRTDGGGWNGSFRTLFAYAPAMGAETRAFSGPDGAVSVFWMVHVHGPWHLRAPGSAIRYALPLSARYVVGLDVALVHWYVPRSWDTGAFIAMPSLQRTLDDRGFVNLRGGPAVVLMGEGPENGATLGLDAMLALSGQPIGVPVSLGAGWLWIPHAGTTAGRGDQHGLMLSLALQF